MIKYEAWNFSTVLMQVKQFSGLMAVIQDGLLLTHHLLGVPFPLSYSPSPLLQFPFSAFYVVSERFCRVILARLDLQPILASALYFASRRHD